MKQAWKSLLAVGTVCTLFSFALVWQVRSVWTLKAEARTQAAQSEQLQTQLADERTKNETLYHQILQYKDDLQQYADDAKEAGGYSKALAQQLEQSMVLSGQSTVTGQGVKVVMKDSKAANPAGVNADNFIIHDEDLLKVVNELRDAGAEAISLNGERLVSTSEIRCAGSIVSVNNNRYAAPFTICAVGNAEEMYNALTMRDGVIDSLSVWGIDCTVTRQKLLTLAGYTGEVHDKYAKPVASKQQAGKKEAAAK